MKILTVADSFGTRWDVDKCWPDYIQQHYNCEVINRSREGCSNEYIADVVENELDDIKPDYTFVLLTESIRSFYIKDRVGSYRQWTGETLAEDYILNVNRIISKTDNVTIMQGLPWHLSTYYIELLNITISNKVSKKIEDSVVHLEVNKSKIDKSKYINFPTIEQPGIFFYLQDNNMTLKDGHPNDNGHKYIAKRFIDELDKKILLQTKS